MILNPFSSNVANRAIYVAPEYTSHRRAMQWKIARSNVQLAGLSSPAEFNLTDLASEVQESLHYRICHRSVAAKDWA